MSSPEARNIWMMPFQGSRSRHHTGTFGRSRHHAVIKFCYFHASMSNFCRNHALAPENRQKMVDNVILPPLRGLKVLHIALNLYSSITASRPIFFSNPVIMPQKRPKMASNVITPPLEAAWKKKEQFSRNTSFTLLNSTVGKFHFFYAYSW